ncbi:MAG: alpha/beta fold hydrolase [Planctomycetes bacterium]|nr:alpha/beta fold hydrolase [Planctomycetota bacterium]
MRASSPMPPLRLEILTTPDGDELQLHWQDTADPRAPLVVLLHGLEGSRRSPYVRATAEAAARHGFAFVALEFRSCSDVPNRSLRTYHSGETTDCAFVLGTLAARAPDRPLLPIGFSLGANVVLKWLGEVGDRAPANVLAAAAISPPYDLGSCGHRCDTRLGGVLARHFLRTMIPKAIAKERRHPGAFDPAAVRRCRTFRAFDELVTVPVFGFRDVDHFYSSQGCGQFLPAIRRPALLVSALDDPLVDPAAVPHAAVAASGFLHARFSKRGGHVAFVAGGAPWRPRRWAEAQALQFFAARLAAAGVTVPVPASSPLS